MRNLLMFAITVDLLDMNIKVAALSPFASVIPRELCF